MNLEIEKVSRVFLELLSRCQAIRERRKRQRCSRSSCWELLQWGKESVSRLYEVHCANLQPTRLIRYWFSVRCYHLQDSSTFFSKAARGTVIKPPVFLSHRERTHQRKTMNTINICFTLQMTFTLINNCIGTEHAAVDYSDPRLLTNICTLTNMKQKIIYGTILIVSVAGVLRSESTRTNCSLLSPAHLRHLIQVTGRRTNLFTILRANLHVMLISRSESTFERLGRFLADALAHFRQH